MYRRRADKPTGPPHPTSKSISFARFSKSQLANKISTPNHRKDFRLLDNTLRHQPLLQIRCASVSAFCRNMARNVRAMFKTAKSLAALNAAYDKSVAAYRFEGDDLDELDALIREAADQFRDVVE